MICIVDYQESKVLPGYYLLNNWLSKLFYYCAIFKLETSLQMHCIKSDGSNSEHRGTHSPHPSPSGQFKDGTLSVTFALIHLKKSWMLSGKFHCKVETHSLFVNSIHIIHANPFLLLLWCKKQLVSFQCIKKCFFYFLMLLCCRTGVSVITLRVTVGPLGECVVGVLCDCRSVTRHRRARWAV